MILDVVGTWLLAMTEASDWSVIPPFDVSSSYRRRRTTQISQYALTQPQQLKKAWRKYTLAIASSIGPGANPPPHDPQLPHAFGPWHARLFGGTILRGLRGLSER